MFAVWKSEDDVSLTEPSIEVASADCESLIHTLITLRGVGRLKLGPSVPIGLRIGP